MKGWSVFFGKCLLYFAIWGGFVAIVTNIGKDTINDIPTWAGMVIVIFVFLAPIWLGKIIWQKGAEITKNITIQIDEIKEAKKAIIETEESKALYTDSRSRFKYLSDELLVAKYKQYQEDELDDMERLALEEELVDRKLITHSPMHEKLDAMMNRY